MSHRAAQVERQVLGLTLAENTIVTAVQARHVASDVSIDRGPRHVQSSATLFRVAAHLDTTT